MYLKVVRRRKLSNAEGTRGVRAQEGCYSTISLEGGGGRGGGSPPGDILNFERFSVRIIDGVLCVWD